MAGIITRMKQPRAIIQRQLWLEQEGYRVVRFWNSEITSDLNAVLERIYVELYGSREAAVEPLKHLRRR